MCTYKLINIACSSFWEYNFVLSVVCFTESSAYSKVIKSTSAQSIQIITAVVMFVHHKNYFLLQKNHMLQFCAKYLCGTDLVSVVGPQRPFHHAVLYIERKVFDIDVAGTAVDAVAQPHHFPRVTHYHVGVDHGRTVL